jgi:hypothetical protein
MTVVVIIFLPLVLGYQTWTYYVFRRRVSRQEFRPPHLPGTPSPAVPEKRDHEFPAEVQGTLMTTPSDPLALQRSKSYRAPLMLAAIIGVPISAAAYFLLSRRGQQDAGVDLHRPAQGRGLPIRTAVVADPAAGAGRAAGRSHHPVPATQGRPLASRPAQGRRRPSRAGR